jgi:hypothetical protein
MDDYLSNKPDNFVDDPEKLYRLRRCEVHQAKKAGFCRFEVRRPRIEGISEAFTTSKSSGESTSTDG